MPQRINFQERGVEVTSLSQPSMDGGTSSLPPGMLPFIQTSIAQPFVNGRNIGLGASMAAAVVVFGILSLLSVDAPVAGALGLAVGSLNITVVLLRYRSHATTPLAVNMNHPFMDDEPLGEAALLVRFADGTWRDPGAHRVRLVPDELLGGFSLAHDTLDFPILGHFTNAKERTPTLNRHLTLINQAIALRDAVNDVPDPIEDARERENQDTGLLERSWLEDEEPLEIESPLVSFFRAKE
jgi:hypothetical protein